MSTGPQLEEYISTSDLASLEFVVPDRKGTVQDIPYLRKNLLIREEAGQEVLDFIQKSIPYLNEDVFVTATTTRFNINKLPANGYRKIINLRRINDVRYINKFFEKVNQKLPVGGIYVNSVETYAVRRKRVIKKFSRPFNWFYYFADVIFTRVFPKLVMTKWFYFFVTKGKSRVLTRAETFGRLYSCGFEVIDEESINNNLYFVVRKIKEPAYDPDPSYGPIVRLRRIGYQGKHFNLYKFRTMYAFSEYLQQYVYEKNGMSNGDKANNDFRVTHLGKIFRKLWIDELPSFLNLLKGDIKLVGARPISLAKFDMYPKEAQERRCTFKPGLIPPFYADMPKSLEELIESENRYFDAYEKSPFITDVRYFFKAMGNIIFRNERSK